MPDTGNIFFVGDTGFEAADDRLIVLQDEHKSGFECPLCGDKDHRIKRGGLDGQTESVVDCLNCHGKGSYLKEKTLVRCALCEGTGKLACPKCKGKGGMSIVIPDATKGRPTTGVVVSIGAGVKYQLGDRLCYPSFAGHAFDLTGVDSEGKTVLQTLVIHIERDILARVHGTLEKKMLKSSQALHTVA